MGTRTYSRRGANGQRVLTAAGRVKFNQMTGLAEALVVSVTKPERLSPTAKAQLETITIPKGRDGYTFPYETEYTPAQIYNDDKKEQTMLDRYTELVQKPMPTQTQREDAEVAELYNRLRVHFLGLEAIEYQSRPAEVLPDNAPEELKAQVQQDNANRLVLTPAQQAFVAARRAALGRAVGGYSNG